MERERSIVASYSLQSSILHWSAGLSLAAPLLTQLHANLPGKATDGVPSAWAPNACVTSAGSWLFLGSHLAVVAIWEVNQYTEDLSLSAFQIKRNL